MNHLIQVVFYLIAFTNIYYNNISLIYHDMGDKKKEKEFKEKAKEVELRRKKKNLNL